MVMRIRTPQVMQSAVYDSERRYTREDWLEEFDTPTTPVTNGHTPTPARKQGRPAKPTTAPPTAAKPVDPGTLGQTCPII